MSRLWAKALLPICLIVTGAFCSDWRPMGFSSRVVHPNYVKEIVKVGAATGVFICSDSAIQNAYADDYNTLEYWYDASAVKTASNGMVTAWTKGILKGQPSSFPAAEMFLVGFSQDGLQYSVLTVVDKAGNPTKGDGEWYYIVPGSLGDALYKAISTK